ncbi:hypothetical protein LR48_Vigan05g069900 [Vigna angularis]|uniref:Uncharacterized protein n=1 Tax=Phaseolus angularis TaxID=3914 RepID=A0A0L9UJP1_PHAAN|nr:hypothetical protein LR48_Vigan05g069900 [Vigna angularis]
MEPINRLKLKIERWKMDLIGETRFLIGGKRRNGEDEARIWKEMYILENERNVVKFYERGMKVKRERCHVWLNEEVEERNVDACTVVDDVRQIKEDAWLRGVEATMLKQIGIMVMVCDEREARWNEK